jgi:hypothetical protein
MLWGEVEHNLMGGVCKERHPSCHRLENAAFAFHPPTRYPILLVQRCSVLKIPTDGYSGNPSSDAISLPAGQWQGSVGHAPDNLLPSASAPHWQQSLVHWPHQNWQSNFECRGECTQTPAIEFFHDASAGQGLCALMLECPSSHQDKSRVRHLLLLCLSAGKSHRYPSPCGRTLGRGGIEPVA